MELLAMIPLDHTPIVRARQRLALAWSITRATNLYIHDIPYIIARYAPRIPVGVIVKTLAMSSRVPRPVGIATRTLATPRSGGSRALRATRGARAATRSSRHPC